MKSLLLYCVVYGIFVYQCLATEFSVVIDSSEPWGISFPNSPSTIEPVSECFMNDYATMLGLYATQDNYFVYPIGGKFTGEGICISDNCLDSKLSYKLNVFPNNSTFVIEVKTSLGSYMQIITGDYTKSFTDTAKYVNIGKCKDLMSVRNLTEAFINCNDTFINNPELENVTCYFPLNTNTVGLELNETHLIFKSNLNGMISFDGPRIKVLHRFGNDVTGPYRGSLFTSHDNTEELTMTQALPAKETHTNEKLHSDDLDVLFILLAVFGLACSVFIFLYVFYYLDRTSVQYYTLQPAHHAMQNGNF